MMSTKNKGEKGGDKKPAKAKATAISLPVRPGFGTLGRKYRMFTNHFEIGFKNNDTVTVNRYHVEIFHPSVKLTREDKRRIFWKFLVENKQLLGISAVSDYHSKILYDGGHSCFSLVRINSVAVKMPDSAKNPCAQKLTIFIKNASPVVIDSNKLMSCSDSGRNSTAVQIVNLLLQHYRSCPILQFASMFHPFKNLLYFVSGSKETHKGLDLGGGVEAWKSLLSTTRVVSDNKAIVNMDVKHSAFYKCSSAEKHADETKGKYTVIQFLCDVLNEAEGQTGAYSPSQLTSETAIPQELRRIFENKIKGLTVCVDDSRASSKASRRHYTIKGVDKPAIERCFADQEGKVLSVAEYFRETARPLKYPKLFTLRSGTDRKPCYLPMEVCYLADNQKVTKPLSEKQTSAMIRQTCLPPAERKAAIESLMKASNFHQDPTLKSFGIDIDPKMICVDGRVLPHPKIAYGLTQSVLPQDGSWKAEGQKLHTPATVNGIAVLALGTMPSNASKFVSNLLEYCRTFGMTVPKVKDVLFHAEAEANAKNVEDGFACIFNQFKQKKLTCELIIVCLPQRSSSLHADVKRFGDTVYGVMTQCVTHRNIQLCEIPTLRSMMFRMNMKLNGTNYCLQTAEEQAGKYLVGAPTLVLGIHVNHPGCGDNGKVSLGGVVGSIDLTQMRYACGVKPQKKVHEQLVDLTERVKDRILAFYTMTSRKPERIFVYRDGVSEGHVQKIIRHELIQIREACMKLQTTYRPKITIIVAQKGTRTRFFPENSQDGVGKHKNIYPGSVVDTDIVHPDEHIFYLCSHSSSQGTSRPNRYHVIYDDNHLSADVVQMITYYLCHCVSHCTNTVNIPAPLYYADKACKLARDHVESNQRMGLFDDGLSDEELSEWTLVGKHGGEAKNVSAAIDVTEEIREKMYFA